MISTHKPIRFVALLLCIVGALPALWGDSRHQGLVVFPVGWDSEQQIKETMAAIDFDLAIVVEEGEQPQILAPFDGTLQDNGENFVYQGHRSRLVFPKTVGLVPVKIGQATEGHVLFIYPKGRTFVFFLRNAKAKTSVYRHGDDKQMGIYSESPLDVYSIGQGEVSVLLSHRLSDSSGMITVIDNSKSPLAGFLYLGVDHIDVTPGTIVKEGAHLGRLSAGLSRYFVGVYALEDGAEVDFLNAYIEIGQ